MIRPLWPHRFVTLLLIASFLAAPLVARAQDVLPGMDLFQSDPGNTRFCFCDAPIPPDFFGPGSDPFDQPIEFEGVPIVGAPLCPDNDLNSIDTIVERLAPALLPAVGASDTVPIEIVALQLTSVQPITVTYNGGQDPELWNLDMTLSGTTPTSGVMTITKTHSGGGTAIVELAFAPEFLFSLGPLSLYYESSTPVDLSVADVPWVYEQAPSGSCTSNFCLNPGAVTVVENGQSSLGWSSFCPTGPVPTESVLWGQVKSLYR